ncbi:MAG: tRNA glutamyl-Q(34) synthetase GluQRS [Pseudomonadota bacterium]
MAYRGRFAPSPTGPLHFGSLVAALASFLDARACNGAWLVRIEDIDPLREAPGASQRILDTLKAHQLIPDEPVWYQSQRGDAYEAALADLRRMGRLYPCPCSRSELGSHGGRHPRGCRDHPDWQQPEPFALRFPVEDRNESWQDRILGQQPFRLERETGDVVLRRKEGFHAYHLAVVVDDIAQGINQVVRGQDLAELTPIHLCLYEALGETPPDYLHFPVVCNEKGQKLSKQAGASAIDVSAAPRNISQALVALAHRPPAPLYEGPVEQQLAWAISAWDPQRLEHA